MNMNFEEAVRYLQSKTVYDDVIIGCFLCNYGDHRLCGACQSSGCKDAARCKHLKKILTDKQ